MEIEKQIPSYWEAEIRAEPNLKLKGKVYYNSLSKDMGGWYEKISKYAFKNSLKHNIFLLYQHNASDALANTKSGTLKVWEERDGLAWEASLPNTSLGRDVHKLVSSGVISETSFAMSNIKDHWVREGGKDVRYVDSAILHEISPVTWASYESNFITARKKQENMDDKLKKLKKHFGSENQMTREEKQRRQERDNKFWSKGKGFDSLAEQLQAVRAYADVGREDHRLRAAGLNESIGSDAGFLVQNDFIVPLFKAGNISELWTRAFRIPVGNFDQIKLPVWDEKSRVNGSLLGGIIFQWTNESGTVDYSNPKFRQLNMNLPKLMALIPYTDELAADAETFNAVMENGVTKGLNFAIEDALIRRNGAGQPQGLLNSSCKIRIAKEAGQNASTIISDNVFKMLARTIPESWSNGDLVWIGHPTTLPEVSTLGLAVGTGGSVNPLWRWRQGGEKFNKLAGLDFIISDRCSVLGSEGDLILCDLKSTIITHKQIQKQISMHVLFSTDEELFRITFKMNSQNILSQPVTPAKGSDKLSTVITLADRS